jgi:Domain of unknown function (DUF5655)
LSTRLTGTAPGLSAEAVSAASPRRVCYDTARFMQGHQCYHCKQWVEAGETHDCWTTTEQALTEELSEELRDAWDRLRETAAAFGEQRIYASHHCIMFSRKACYLFVRPKRSALEVVFFLGRAIVAEQIWRTERPSQKKVAHIIHLRHRDEVEAPITGWLREAYDVADTLSGRGAVKKSEKAAGEKPATKKLTAKQASARQRTAKRRQTQRAATRNRRVDP